MGLWNKIKRFFSGEKREEDLNEKLKGDLEATVETVNFSDDDLSVEFFEMSEDADISPEEDPDIEVEIVDSDEEDTFVLSELDPAEPSENTESFLNPDNECVERAENVEGSPADCPSRMTDEYKQWLKEQETQRNQQDNSIES
ncbi:MAG: hypothetical protein Q4F31_02250 [Eubacteriales bacterium]|nr:hypothetical protein [Eubacteriales bacterium]